MKPQPLISIVTVVFNDVGHIEDTIRSVLSQTYDKVEYIIIDGGSTDGTLDVIRRYENRLAYCVSEADKGIYDAMNKGLATATGEWINFMNCGDRFASDEVLELFRMDLPDAAVVFGDAIIEYPTFSRLYPRRSIDQLWKGMAFCHQASFVRTVVMKMFKFDLHFRLGADFDFFYRAYQTQERFLYIDRVICHFNFTQGASTTYAIRSIQDRRDSVLRRNFDFQKWLYYFFLIQYVRLSIVVKSIIGRRLTAWLTRSLRT